MPHRHVATPLNWFPQPYISPSFWFLCRFKTLDNRPWFSELLLYFINRMGGNLLSQTLKDLHLEHLQLLKRAIHLAASFDGWKLISSSLHFPLLPALATHGSGSPSWSLTGPAVRSLGHQAWARAEPPPAAVVGYGGGGWVSASGCSSEDLSFPLTSVYVGVCTRMCSQNKSVPVWEINVKSVFCKSWPGSCFHITNQKQLDVFLGASAFPNQCNSSP